MPRSPLDCDPVAAASLLVTSGLNTCDPAFTAELPRDGTVPPRVVTAECVGRERSVGADACSKIQSEAARACSGGQR